MAKNYTITEAVEILTANEDAEQIAELGRRYPLLVNLITRVSVKAPKEFQEFMANMPENLSANKVNQLIKKNLEEGGDAEDDFDDEAEETPAPKKADKKAAKKPAKPAADEEDEEDEAEGGDADYDNWNNAKMYKLLGELGKRKDCKEKMGSLSHDAMLKYLKKYYPNGVDGAEEEAEDEAEEAPAEESYDGMAAPELYKLCKKRGIKAEQKKPAKYYIGLLKKADEAAAQAEDEAEDEDWDDEEEEEAPAPKKKAATKPAAKDGGKKPAKKQKEEEEDDEDWDI